MKEQNRGGGLRAVEGRLRGKGRALVIWFTKHGVEAMREFSV